MCGSCSRTGSPIAFPIATRCAREFPHSRQFPREGRALRIAVHVRRGEQVVLNSERMLPNSYFIEVALNVAHTLRALKLDFQIELYTEVPGQEFVVQPEDHGIFNRISAPFELHPDMSRIDEFSVLPNLVHRINGRVIDCIRGLATADVLVMSRSSFSYLGEFSTGRASFSTTLSGTRRPHPGSPSIPMGVSPGRSSQEPCKGSAEFRAP